MHADCMGIVTEEGFETIKHRPFYCDPCRSSFVKDREDVSETVRIISEECIRFRTTC